MRNEFKTKRKVGKFLKIGNLKIGILKKESEEGCSENRAKLCS